MKWLQGKKTYIMAVIIGVYNLGLLFGWWTADNQAVLTINTILGALGLGSLRAGVTTAAKSSKEAA